MNKPVLPLDSKEKLSMPRPAPKPSQSIKKRGSKPKEAQDEAGKTE